MPPEYERWAAFARKQITEQSKKTNEIMASNLNESTKAALVLVLDRFETSFNDMSNDLNQKMAAMETRLDQKFQSQTSLITNSFSTATTTTTTTKTATTTLQHADHMIPPSYQHLPQQQQFALSQPQQQQTEQQIQQQTQQPTNNSNALLALRSTPRQPIFPPSFPKTVYDLEIQYQKHNLQEWENIKMNGWDTKLKMAYGRWKYMREAVKARAMSLHHGTFDQRLIRAAERMDEEREVKGMSTSKYMEFLKKNDKTITQRKKRKL